MKTITQETLNKKLKLHKMWLNNNNEGKRLDLSFYDLSRLRFKNADCRKAIFSGAKFEYTNCDYANFENANFFHSEFFSANCNYANFENANCGCSSFKFSNLNNANFKKSECNFTNFNNARCYETNFNSANLLYANFDGTRCIKADFRGAFIDYSSGFSLDNAGVNIIVDNRIQIQLLFHAYKQINEDENPDQDLKELFKSELFKKVIIKYHNFTDLGGFNEEE